MANAKIGSQASWGLDYVETIDTTGKQLVRGDSGKVFMCVQNSTADVEINLPQLSTDMAGWHAKFILKTASSNDFAITAYGSALSTSTAGDSDTIVVYEYANDHASAGSVDSAADSIYFKASVAEAGNVIDIHTDGTSWFALAFTRTAADVSAAG